MKHLTDEELQDYLDGNTPEMKAAIEEHLEICASCRENMQIYEGLYTRLRDESGISLSPDFAETVIAKIPEIPPARARFNYLNILWAILGIAVVIGVSMHYTDLNDIGATTVNSLIPKIDLQAPQISMMEKPSFEVFEKYKLLFIGGIILVLVLVMDQIFIGRRFFKHKVLLI